MIICIYLIATERDKNCTYGLSRTSGIVSHNHSALTYIYRMIPTSHRPIVRVLLLFLVTIIAMNDHSFVLLNINFLKQRWLFKLEIISRTARL